MAIGVKIENYQVWQQHLFPAMNYLAHAYLSFGDKNILLGNMISDFVKGNKQYQYREPIRKGIILHRFIDTFTDTHEATHEAKSVFRNAYRLYSGAIVDVVYDHFLANDLLEFTESSLYQFSQETYLALTAQEEVMPLVFRTMFHFMRSQNWLFGYRTSSGTQKALRGVVRRALYMDDADPAIQILEEHYDFLNDCYRHFWESARPRIYEKWQELKEMPTSF
jgi:acyl carrier protein phosphodiesterase